MTQEAEQAVKRAQQACERIKPQDIEPWDPVWLNEPKSPAEKRTVNAELRRLLRISRDVEASLRRENEALKASERRWSDRIKALEARLSQVIAVASGERP